MKFEFSTFKTVASCSILMLTNLSLSGQTTFTINSETSKTISANESFIYPVEYREIEYYPYIEGKVSTDSYKFFLNKQKELKDDYDEYILNNENNSAKNGKKLKIIELLNSYLSNSKDERLLDDAYKLSKDLNLKYIVDDNSSSYDGWGVKPKKTLYIKDEKGRYASKSILREYLMSVNNDQNFYNKIPMSYEAKEYLQKLEEEKEMTDSDKYEIGRIKLEKLSKRKAYLVLKDREIKDFSKIFGNYKEISITMLIANTTIEDRFIENELSEDVSKYYRYDGGNQYTLIENTVTGKFYVIPYNAYSSITAVYSDEIAIRELASTGYKIENSNGYKFINTKHYKIQATNALKKRLEKEKDYLKKLDIWFEEREAIRKQTIAMIPKLDHYIRLYRMQRNRMSKADISAWTALTKSANLLNKKQVDLNDKLFGWTDRNDSDKNYYKYSDEFINYLSASSNVLGI